MTLATPSPYNIRKSIEGNLIGLDGTQQGTGLTPLGDYTPYIMGKDLKGFRLFPVGFTGVQGSDYKIAAPIIHNDLFDDFLGKQLDTNKWNANKGSDGSTGNAYNIQNGGVNRLTTGAGSTHTMAVNGAQLTGALNFKVSNGGLRMETRLGNASALTSQSICFGLADVSTLSAPFTISGTTVTATGSNGVAFCYDAAATGVASHLNAVAVNAGGSPQVVNLTQDIDTAAFHVYRIEVDAAGNATFYIDNVLVATILLAMATTAVLCPSVGMFSEATSGSQTLDCDYIYAQQARV